MPRVRNILHRHAQCGFPPFLRARGLLANHQHNTPIVADLLMRALVLPWKKLAHLSCFQNPVINRKTSETHKQRPTWANFILLSAANRDILPRRFVVHPGTRLWETSKSENRNTHHEMGEIMVATHGGRVRAQKTIAAPVKPVPTVWLGRGTPKGG